MTARTFSIEIETIVRRDTIDIVECRDSVRVTQKNGFGFPWTLVIPKEQLGEVIAALQQLHAPA